MRDGYGTFIVSQPIAGLMSDDFNRDIRQSIANVHWYTNYTIFFHGLKKDRRRHVTSITHNVASVLVF